MRQNESYSVLSVNYKEIWFVGYENFFIFIYICLCSNTGCSYVKWIVLQRLCVRWLYINQDIVFHMKDQPIFRVTCQS